VTVNGELNGFTVLHPPFSQRGQGTAVNVGQGNTGGIRRIARWGLSETQKANDHKGNLVLLGVAVTDHCGLDLSGGVRVDGNFDAA